MIDISTAAWQNNCALCGRMKVGRGVDTAVVDVGPIDS